MVNEIADDKNDERAEEKPWTLRLGKYVTYNPSPFKSREDFMMKTFASALIAALGIVMLLVPNLPVQIMGGLTLGSMLFCYVLSICETRLYENWSRNELR
jgi:hypothetical protein